MTISQKTIIKRNGKRVPFDKIRVYQAIEKSFLSEQIVDPVTVATLTDLVVQMIDDRLGLESTTHVEEVQDLVEETLMTNGYLKIAKKYILYREARKQSRQESILSQIRENRLEVAISDSETIIFNPKMIEEKLRRLSTGLPQIDVAGIVESVSHQVYDKIPKSDLDLLILASARERIEVHYAYSALSARIALNDLYSKILNQGFGLDGLGGAYRSKFIDYIHHGIELEMLTPKLSEFDCEKLAAALVPERDMLTYFLGVQILIDRYLLRDRSRSRDVYELPQWFWMRVAMGLALNEPDKTQRAIEFYTVLSKMDVISSTPTLFNSGTLNSQMSSCYLNIADDSLNGIFKLYSDNANLSKWAGGIGSDWTPVRATGSPIKGTNGTSQGVVPFIKIFNDVALAVNQGGKRKGAMCAYMEVWHLDFEQFLELRKNTGDDRRRTHDINTAAWIPDLFMKRVKNNQQWTFFCPSDVPELHDCYGSDFEARYVAAEAQNFPQSRTVNAGDLWRKMLTMLYETGHPWITFKDAANVRNPQDHVGVIHCSNLCTEITLNTSKDETAVCNLASINLANMIQDGALNTAKIAETVRVAIRMLDNVIDNNFYPIPEAKNANFRHRAIGLGVMGYQDALYQLNIPFDSTENLEFADSSMEVIAYHAILSSSELAKERGTYPTYSGSKWDRGILPHDTIDLLERERGVPITVDRQSRLDWTPVRQSIAAYGMRNSNTMAIAPTATIANIAGVFPCIEPAYKNIYMKENLSGNFIVINRYLLDDLVKLGLWNSEMVSRIKRYNGSIATLTEIPEMTRKKYKEVFEIDSQWVIKAAALRSKWIDQSASTNVFISTVSGKHLSDIYTLAWESGLKTTYYLRTLGASQVSKSTIDSPVEATVPVAQTSPPLRSPVDVQPTLCLIEDGTCESCQ